ncbi:Tetratricopeptide-like helical [Penicillium expansum]|nr:Tetratricopeptide-like helical [Penicillium expansum]
MFWILVAWCLLLSPLHVFISVPSLLAGFSRTFDNAPHRGSDVVYDPGNTTSVDVYAIHGLGSDPASTWNNSQNGTNVCWLKDLLPKVPGLTNIKVTMANHQSHWSEDAANMQFEDHARTLLDEIERIVPGSSSDPHHGEVAYLDADHRGLNKFASTDDPNFIKFKARFTKAFLKALKNAKVTSIPFSRDARFTGRQDILLELDQKLRRSQFATLAGIGGAGKTHIAVEYAYRFQERHPCADIFWVQAGTKDMIEKGYKEIAVSLDLPADNPEGLSIFSRVSSALDDSREGHWLLVFDGLNDPNLLYDPNDVSPGRTPEIDQLIANMPHSAKGYTLLTTRDRRVGHRLTGIDDTISVSPMGLEDARELMTILLHEKPGLDDNRTMEQIIQALQGLPFYLSQAAGYIATKEVSLEHYLHLLSNPTETTELIDQSHNNTDLLRGLKTRAADILCLMATLDAQSIPIQLLQRCDESLVAFDKETGLLKSFFLITSNAKGDNLGMLRLQQLSIQHWLELQNSLDEWKENAMDEILRLCAHLTGRKQYDCLETVYPHIQHLLAYDFRTRNSRIKVGYLLILKSEYDTSRGRFALANEQLLRSVGIWKTSCSDHSYYAIRGLQLQARALAHQNQMDEAEYAIRAAFCAFGQVYGPDDSNTLSALMDLGSVLRHKKLDEAEHIYSTIFYLTLGRMIENQAYDLEAKHNLGLIAETRGNHSEAERILRETLHLKQQRYAQRYGHESEFTLRTMNLLAIVLQNQGKNLEAESMFRQTLRLREGVLGITDKDTMYTLKLLVRLLWSSKKFDEVVDFAFQRAERQKMVHGIRNNDTLDAFNDLEGVLFHQGRYNDAITSIEKTIPVREDFLGPDDPGTLMSKVNYAVSLCGQGRKREGLNMFQDVLETRKRLYGSEDPRTLKTQENVQIATNGIYADPTVIIEFCPSD